MRGADMGCGLICKAELDEAAEPGLVWAKLEGGQEQPMRSRAQRRSDARAPLLCWRTQTNLQT
eukprot:723728-Rhodomonas_salina.2